jgi:hypothetical protein
MSQEREVKVLTTRPGRPKGVKILSDRPGNPPDQIEILQSGVKIIDQETPKPQPEITQGEGDSGSET